MPQYISDDVFILPSAVIIAPLLTMSLLLLINTLCFCPALVFSIIFRFNKSIFLVWEAAILLLSDKMISSMVPVFFTTK